MEGETGLLIPLATFLPGCGLSRTSVLYLFFTALPLASSGNAVPFPCVLIPGVATISHCCYPWMLPYFLWVPLSNSMKLCSAELFELYHLISARDGADTHLSINFGGCGQGEAA